MSRLDHHVAEVRTRLTLRRFVHTLAWVTLYAGLALLLAVIAWKVFAWHTPPYLKWIGLGAVGVMVVSVLGVELARRPSEQAAALAIDEKLNLQEKFSTALTVRNSKDLFAQAAVRDAERTAENVQLQRQFPVQYPRVAYWAKAVIGAAVIVMFFVKPLDLFGHAAQQAKKADEKKAEVAQAEKAAEKALALVEAMPRQLGDDAKIKAEAKALAEMLKNQHFDDPSRMSRKAHEVLQDVQQKLADEAAKTATKNMEQNKAWSQTFGDASDYKSDDVKKVDQALAKNDFGKAVKDIEKLTNNFEKMNAKEKEQVAKDMEKLADKLKNAANDPKVQKDIQDKLQQMGASQQQAQQMAQQMMQAAQGDKQAQQQVQQMAQQMQQQLQQQAQQLQQQAQAGNQQAQQQLQQIQQQQQQIQQALQGMQGQANAQAQAQQMSQAAQQMAQAMQQQAQAQQSGQQNSQQGQGSQQGQQGQSQAQMAQSQAQMQQAMQSMQAAQADANQVASAQQQAMGGSQGEGETPGQNGQGGNGEGQASPNGQGKGNDQAGEYKPNDPNGQGEGSGEGGVSFGGKNSNKAVAGFNTKTEHDIGKENDKGKMLANTFIKDNNPIKGEAKLGLQQITETVEKQAADEVDEDHVSGQSRKAAEEYFRTMHEDVAKK